MPFLALLVALLLSSCLPGQTWLVTGPQAPEPVEGWVTEPANTALATQHILDSAAVGGPVSYHVYLPAAHAADPQRRFPVVYWLHGSGDGTLGIPALAQLFDNAMAAGAMPPAIVVFPNGLPHGMWCDSKDGRTPVESMLIDDLIPHIDATQRTIAAREGRIIEGFSMGGYGAGRLGLKHHHLFRAISMMGAGPLQLDFLEDDPNLQPIELRERLFLQVYGGDMDYYLELHPWTIAEAEAENLPEDLRLRIAIGTLDRMLANNRLFREHLAALGIAHDYIEIEGVGHQPLATILGIGPANWAFYREVLGQR